MATACAAFGPDSSFLFNSPSKWSFNGIPDGITELMTKAPKAKDILDVALGPDGSYCVVYTNQAGEPMLRRNELPPALEKWFIPVPGNGLSAKRDLASLNVALGPNGSFFAFDSNGAFWSNLPAGFNDALSQRLDSKGNFKSGDYPQSVSLGADGTYVMTTVGGGGMWNLCGTNDILSNFLKESKSLKGIYVILSPSRTGVHLVVTNTGGCASTTPTSCHQQYLDFAEDWKTSCQRVMNQAAVRRRNAQQSANIGKAVVKGLGLMNKILNAANGNASGGGGQVYTSDTYVQDNSMDMSSFWAPINSAASDPIQ
ncbi:hypothetical protein NA57DRAFT_79389 [Rhizodiscina lignyota]|uniref:Uncharacterized protein n=1 Tax=Rhizodiscina lignyota TaxID=1504668 RepID=A0A9P4I5R7_9PEZI|nr:hypothetical protein NA57DRAFT_79389 [Rhizodiscina lignyota]